MTSGSEGIYVKHTPEEKHLPHLVCHRADTRVRPCHTRFRQLYFPTVYFMTYMTSGAWELTVTRQEEKYFFRTAKTFGNGQERLERLFQEIGNFELI